MCNNIADRLNKFIGINIGLLLISFTLFIVSWFMVDIYGVLDGIVWWTSFLGINILVLIIILILLGIQIFILAIKNSNDIDKNIRTSIIINIIMLIISMIVYEISSSHGMLMWSDIANANLSLGDKISDFLYFDLWSSIDMPIIFLSLLSIIIQVIVFIRNYYNKSKLSNIVSLLLEIIYFVCSLIVLIIIPIFIWNIGYVIINSSLSYLWIILGIVFSIIFCILNTYILVLMIRKLSSRR